MDLPPLDLRKLHEDKYLCPVCHGLFYGSERLAFFLGCQPPHIIHHRCLTTSVYTVGAQRSYKCSICQELRGINLLQTLDMPSDLPHRLPRGNSQQEGHPPPPPPPPPPPSPPPSLLPHEFFPQSHPQLLPKSPEALAFKALDGPQPNDCGQIYCSLCGHYLDPNEWMRSNDRVLCERCSLTDSFHVRRIRFGATQPAGEMTVRGDSDEGLVRQETQRRET